LLLFLQKKKTLLLFLKEKKQNDFSLEQSQAGFDFVTGLGVWSRGVMVQH
jgi:hypothetical protein